MSETFLMRPHYSYIQQTENKISRALTDSVNTQSSVFIAREHDIEAHAPLPTALVHGAWQPAIFMHVRRSDITSPRPCITASSELETAATFMTAITG